MKKFLYSVFLFIIFFLMLGVYFGAVDGKTTGAIPTLMFFAFLFGLYKIWKSKPNKTKGADFPFHSSLREDSDDEDDTDPEIEKKILSIGFVQKAKIAQKVIKEFPSNEYDQLEPMLTTESKKKEALKELNQKLAYEYEEALLFVFGESDPKPLKKDYQGILAEIMTIGLEAIFERYGFSESDAGSKQSGREISESGTWQDIKGRN